MTPCLYCLIACICRLLILFFGFLSAFSNVASLFNEVAKLTHSTEINSLKKQIVNDLAGVCEQIDS